MRTLVFLLILANLLFFVWSQDYLGLSQNPDAGRVHQQLLAEKVRIVSNDVPPPVEAAKSEKAAAPAEKPPAETTPSPAPPPPRPTEICVQLNDIPPADAEKLQNEIADKLLALKVTRTTTPGTTSYWVHIPPAKNRNEAENNTAELKRIGVKDYFIVQESGANYLAVSLGLFSTRDAAASALAMFRGLGAKQAKITERIVKPPLSQLEIRGPDSGLEEINQLVASRMKDVKRATCKPRSSP